VLAGVCVGAGWPLAACAATGWLFGSAPDVRVVGWLFAAGAVAWTGAAVHVAEGDAETACPELDVDVAFDDGLADDGALVGEAGGLLDWAWITVGVAAGAAVACATESHAIPVARSNPVQSCPNRRAGTHCKPNANIQGSESVLAWQCPLLRFRF
jgi:hypothetical protein